MFNLSSTAVPMKSPMADAPVWEGIIALLVTVLGLGTYHVPIRTFPAGDGFFVQWSMSIGILCSGFIVHATQGFPGFEPIAVVGGMFWAIANALSQRVISGLGLAVGLLLWNATNCLTGWFIGRFGLFGVTSKPPRSDVLNATGLCVMLLGSFLISFVKKVPRTDQQAPNSKNNLSN
ncbi:hypothetical protein M3Y97_01115300 [Aphelenchoides bicaudatus]|nr:hypothetical protein M3Y97_01115300 [Aphelenchoides bicaudatus]